MTLPVEKPLVLKSALTAWMLMLYDVLGSRFWRVYSRSDALTLKTKLLLGKRKLSKSFPYRMLWLVSL